MSDFVLLNNEFVPAAEASVSVHDGGFLHGAGLFETMPVRNGHVFRLDSHLRRLRTSAHALQLPYSDELLPSRDRVLELLERNSVRGGRVRLTLTSGPMERSGLEGATARPTVCVTVGRDGAYPTELYERGVKVVISSSKVSPSDPTAGHKTTGYFPKIVALREAHQTRCFESVWFTTNNHVAEGCISNIFIVKDGVISTPPTDTPVLPGIARGVVLELAAALELGAEQSPLTVNDLLDADEVFLTNAIMRVMPVVGVERETIGEGAVGPIAKKLMHEYQCVQKKECGCA